MLNVLLETDEMCSSTETWLTYGKNSSYMNLKSFLALRTTTFNWNVNVFVYIIYVTFIGTNLEIYHTAQTTLFKWHLYVYDVDFFFPTFQTFNKPPLPRRISRSHISLRTGKRLFLMAFNIAKDLLQIPEFFLLMGQYIVLVISFIEWPMKYLIFVF